MQHKDIDDVDLAVHYHDEYWDLLEICYKAIRSGDWKVDGACDPDRHIRKFKQMEDEVF